MSLTRPQLEALAVRTVLQEAWGLVADVHVGTGPDYGALVVEASGDLEQLEDRARDAEVVLGVRRAVVVRPAGEPVEPLEG